MVLKQIKTKPSYVFKKSLKFEKIYNSEDTSPLERPYIRNILDLTLLETFWLWGLDTLSLR